MNKEWLIWEVFVGSKQGLDHKHCSNLHAPDEAPHCAWRVASTRAVKRA